MSFQPDKVDEFLAIFNRSMMKISDFEGCTHLSLHRDHTASNVYFTVSHWETVDYLELYRHSTLFNQTWGQVKPLFNDKPIAYSLDN